MLCRTLLNAELSLCYRTYTRGIFTQIRSASYFILSESKKLELTFDILTYFPGLSTSLAWDVLTGVCVERLPVITPPLNEMQQKYKNLLSTIEIENSLKSDHEMRHESDKYVSLSYKLIRTLTYAPWTTKSLCCFKK